MCPCQQGQRADIEASDLYKHSGFLVCPMAVPVRGDWRLGIRLRAERTALSERVARICGGNRTWLLSKREDIAIRTSAGR